MSNIDHFAGRRGAETVGASAEGEAEVVDLPIVEFAPLLVRAQGLLGAYERKIRMQLALLSSSLDVVGKFSLRPDGFIACDSGMGESLVEDCGVIKLLEDLDYCRLDSFISELSGFRQFEKVRNHYYGILVEGLEALAERVEGLEAYFLRDSKGKYTFGVNQMDAEIHFTVPAAMEELLSCFPEIIRVRAVGGDSLVCSVAYADLEVRRREQEVQAEVVVAVAQTFDGSE